MIAVKKINFRGSALSLSEAIVLIVILFILGAYIFSNLFKAYVAESAAAANVRIIYNICQLNRVNSGVYPENLLSLSTSGCRYIDSALASGSKQGYIYTYSLVSAEHFTVNADPDLRSGCLVRGKHFYTDETGIIHAAKETRQASSSDPVLN